MAQAAPTVDQLHAVIQYTMSPVDDTRKNAEDSLRQAQQIPGFSMVILQLVNTTTVDVAIRQAAAVNFKNFVKKNWDKEMADIKIEDSDRTLIKNNLVQLMCEVPPQIQLQCSAAINLIAEQDYPGQWEALLPSLVSQFETPDPNVLKGVLLTCDAIFERFRYQNRSDELYSVIIYSLKRVQAPLLRLFQVKSAKINTLQNDKSGLKIEIENLSIMCRLFYSLNQQDVPEFFEDNVKAWMTEFSKFLQYQNPLLVDQDEEEQPGPIENLQAEIVEDLNLYTNKDEEFFIPFLQDFTKIVWDLLMRLSVLPKHDVLSIKCISFLSSLVQKPMHKSLFASESTLQDVIARIVIPNLVFREADKERFEDDPAEFIATDIEGNEAGTRRKCSQELLKAMCRQFVSETTLICHKAVAEKLAEYKTNPEQNWAAKDVAIHLMFGISIVAENRNGVSQVHEVEKLMDFFSTHVFVDLQDTNHNTVPLLKATSIKFVCTFRNQFTIEQLSSLMPLLIAHLSSPVVVVHTYAAYTIEKILSVKGKFGPPSGASRGQAAFVAPFSSQLFGALFGVVNNTVANENEHAMKCIMRALVVTNDADLVPNTDNIVTNLANALEFVSKNPRNPRYNHYIFECIAALVRSVCTVQPDAQTAFEDFLRTPFQAILIQDVAEFTPYVYQLFSQLLELRAPGSGLGETYSNLLIPLIAPAAWQRQGNVPALARLVRAYLEQDAGAVCQLTPITSILGVWQSVLSSRSTEQFSFDLLRSIFTFVPQEQLAPTMVKEIFRILMTKLRNGNANGKNVKFKRYLTDFCAFYAGKMGPQAYFDAMDSLQPNLGETFLNNVWLKRITEDTPRGDSARYESIGLSRLCFDNSPLLANGTQNSRAVWAAIIVGIVRIFAENDANLTAAAEDAVVGEIAVTSDGAFSEVTLARQVKVDWFAESGDPKGVFFAALGSLSQTMPGQLQPMLQAAFTDAQLANKLQELLSQFNVVLA